MVPWERHFCQWFRSLFVSRPHVIRISDGGLHHICGPNLFVRVLGKAGILHLASEIRGSTCRYLKGPFPLKERCRRNGSSHWPWHWWLRGAYTHFASGRRASQVSAIGINNGKNMTLLVSCESVTCRQAAHKHLFTWEDCVHFGLCQFELDFLLPMAHSGTASGQSPLCITRTHVQI